MYIGGRLDGSILLNRVSRVTTYDVMYVTYRRHCRYSVVSARYVLLYQKPPSILLIVACLYLCWKSARLSSTSCPFARTANHSM